MARVLLPLLIAIVLYFLWRGAPVRDKSAFKSFVRVHKLPIALILTIWIFCIYAAASGVRITFL